MTREEALAIINEERRCLILKTFLLDIYEDLYINSQLPNYGTSDGERRMAMSSDFVQKVWGYEWPLHNAEFCMKVMGLDQGSQCSIHCHKIKKEMFLVTEGAIRVELWEKLPTDTEFKAGTIILPEGCDINLAHPDKILILDERYSAAASVYVDNFVLHRFIGLGKLNEFIEASTHDDPVDSYRFTKSRKPDNR